FQYFTACLHLSCEEVPAETFDEVDCSSIVLDWSLESPDTPVKGIMLQYSPPVGKPLSGTVLDSHTSSIIINDTLAATEYTLFITALLEDGTSHNISTKRLSSSPAPPVFESAETTSSDATISFFPPAHDAGDVSYAIEYHPLDKPEYANFVESRAPLFKIRGLDPLTAYRLKINSVYRNTKSDERIDVVFTTKGDSGESFTVRTLPPNFGTLLGQGKCAVQSVVPPIAAKETEATPSAEILIEASAESNQRSSEIPFRIVTTPTFEEEEEEDNETTTTTIRPSRATFVISSLLDKAMTAQPASPDPTTTERITVTEKIIDRVEETTVPSTTTTTTMRALETTQKPVSDPREHLKLSSMTSSSSIPEGFPDPAHVFLSMTEDKMLRLDWEVPEGTVCDSFLVNYTLLTLNDPQTLQASTNDQWVQMKMYTDHTIDIKVFCLVSGAASKLWWAHRVADLSKPSTPSGLRLLSSYTDEFYASSLALAIDWPVFHDFSFYKLVVAYSTGKKPTDQNLLEVDKEGPIVLEKLEATKWYSISVKNVSIELGVESVAVPLRELTPPIISSQLQPGQISSTSININFDESDPEQGKFDSYELTFTGNAKNITKRLGLNAARSFTFTKLIPGKTYNFELFTVFEGRRSRPVTSNVTTYPLKVNKLYPVVGRDYVVLFWDIENFADNDVRFRVAYVAISNSGHKSDSTVVLRNKNTYKFDKLPGDTYYTFTCTVIMGMGAAEAESESEMITISIGMPARSVPSVTRHGSRELAVQFENDPSVFSEQNGEVDNFAVIVTEKRDLGGDDYDLQSWFEVKDEEMWSAYRASSSDFNPFRGNRKKSATFTIGADDCVQRRLDEPYCNGMLRANTDYYVKVRAYTKEGVAMETEWVSVAGATEEGEEDKEKERRLPCHMYLNGCPRKSAAQNTSFFQPLLTLLGFFVPRHRIR
ncbi:hypothetical protein PENTCL1PPCAC_5847, partial [Pristionchus entomophagus]